MGVIVNDEYQDPRGFATTQTYASFSELVYLQKIKQEMEVEISSDDASGNSDAYVKKINVVDENGNRSIDSKGKVLTKEVYMKKVYDYCYEINATLAHYYNKEARINEKDPIHNYEFQMMLPLTDFAKLFEKLYEKIKTDKELFPYNNLTDDL